MLLYLNNWVCITLLLIATNDVYFQLALNYNLQQHEAMRY